MISKTAQEIWDAALGSLQVQVSKTNFDTWLRGTQGISFDGTIFIVWVPNTFSVEWIQHRLRTLLERCLFDLLKQPVTSEFTTTIEKAPPSSLVLSHPPVRKPTQGLNTQYTFTNFVVGQENNLAHSAALEAVQKDNPEFNPLFIHSTVGLGKTHLLHAIGHASNVRGRLLRCITATEFTRDFVASLREGLVQSFEDSFADLQLLLIDDIQFFAGKEQTAEQFFHIFNTLHTKGVQIVLTSDKPPREMLSLSDRFRSRLSGGLLVDLSPPSLETQVVILDRKSRQAGLPMGEATLLRIASYNTTNIRELEGALNRVISYARLFEIVPTPELVDILLAAFQSRLKQTISPQTILLKVADHFDTPIDVLRGTRRDRRVSLARHVAIYLLRQHTSLSFAEIARELGGRDHSSILYGFKKISRGMSTDSTLSQTITTVGKTIVNSPTPGKPG